MLGKAMDFHIPDVQLAKLRALAMQMQVGGVGYYPTSGSPFVHLNVGNVRAWPRMSRKELAKTFPKGRTMHLAADGSSLPGYARAVADYKKRVSRNSIIITSSASEIDELRSRQGETASTLLTALYPNPKSLALDALALQIGGQAESQSFADLKSHAVRIPFPSTKPVFVSNADPAGNTETASLRPTTNLPKSTPVVGFESSEIARAHLKMRMDQIGGLPMTVTWR